MAPPGLRLNPAVHPFAFPVCTQAWTHNEPGRPSEAQPWGVAESPLHLGGAGNALLVPGWTGRPTGARLDRVPHRPGWSSLTWSRPGVAILINCLTIVITTD